MLANIADCRLFVRRSQFAQQAVSFVYGEKNSLLLALCFVIRAVAQTHNGATDQDQRLVEELTRFSVQQAANDKFSGVVLLAKSGAPILQNAYGFLEQKSKTPNTLDTRFDLGSMPKMFTAVAIAQ